MIKGVVTFYVPVLGYFLLRPYSYAFIVFFIFMFGVKEVSRYYKKENVKEKITQK